MDNRSLKVLEYDKIIALLEQCCESEMGRKKAFELLPSIELSEIISMQEETDEALVCILKKGNPPLFGINDMSIYAKRLDIGGYLMPKALIEVSDLLRGARAMRDYLGADSVSDEPSVLSNLVSGLYSNIGVENTINTAIIGEDEISDAASPKLRQIRRDIQQRKDSIAKKLSQLVGNQDNKKYLQDSIVTVREGRYVVPVKAENRSKIQGIVHDTSSSGATVFVEPMAVVEANNEIRELELAEKREIERILMEISAELAEISSELYENSIILSELDFIFAKGKLARMMNATRPLLNNNGITKLNRARHPLIDPHRVVPIDMKLGGEFTTLVITGPNTGGKTVSLKTLGLLTVMAQSGLNIPVSENSEVGILSNVFADIGDEQSIEQSLSTFSAHMVNIVRIMNDVDKDSLVLFDELGAGTDPTEGAALAMSILDYMLSRQIRTVATTHYNQLKMYAITTPGVQNASMEFNVDTLSPTYRLLIGLPGKSNAFEISKRLGLSEFIIEYARELVSKENVEFEDILKAVEDDRRKAEELLEETQKMRELQKHKEEKIERELESIERQKNKILTDAKSEAAELLKSTKAEADLILDEIKRLKLIIDRDNASKLQQATEVLKKNLDAVATSNLGFDIRVKEPPKDLKVGETVEIVNLGQIGTVLSIADNNGEYEIQVGMMKMKISLDRLRRTEKAVESKRTAKKIMERKSKTISPEIDLRGKNIEEARYELSKYIDDACLAGLKEIRIIHGKGTGMLREGTRAYLKSHKRIKSQRVGGYNEGGTGVTVAELK